MRFSKVHIMTLTTGSSSSSRNEFNLLKSSRTMEVLRLQIRLGIIICKISSYYLLNLLNIRIRRSFTIQVVASMTSSSAINTICYNYSLCTFFTMLFFFSEQKPSSRIHLFLLSTVWLHYSIFCVSYVTRMLFLTDTSHVIQ